MPRRQRPLRVRLPIMAALARRDTRQQQVFAAGTGEGGDVALRTLHSAVRRVAEDRRRIETLWLLRRRNRWNIQSSPYVTRQILRAGYGVAERALLAKHNRLGANESGVIVRCDC